MLVATPSAAGGTIRYHDCMAVIIGFELLRTSQVFLPTPTSRLATDPVRPKTRQVYRILAIGCLIATALLLSGCSTGRLSGTSSGWSPVAAVVLPTDTGARLSEGGELTAFDDILTVTSSGPFTEGQVIQIDQEQLRITAVRGNQLSVERGVGGTRARLHVDRAVISSIGDQLVVVIVTKQGDVKALSDDGSQEPRVLWSFRPRGDSR